MQAPARGASAALFVSARCAPFIGLRASIVAAALAAVVAGISCATPAAAGPTLAPHERTLSSGVTIAVRRATASPTVALEVWVACPSSGYGDPQPGLARLAAIALVSQKDRGGSLRDAARADGARLNVAVFSTSTEFVITAPSYAAPTLIDALVTRIFHPKIDAVALADARKVVTAQQIAAAATPDVALRDAVFASLFAGGPYHDSTYGTAETLKSISLAGVRTFAAAAFVPSNAIVVAVGDLDERAIGTRIESAAPLRGPGRPVPASTLATNPSAGRTIAGSLPEVAGVATGWVGPPISDNRAATAMDFLSDYLTRPEYGAVPKAVGQADPEATFMGQFVTLESPGVFYLLAAGRRADPQALASAMRAAFQRVVTASLPSADFARALSAFRTHMLRDTQTPQAIADNYGWYFVQGAPAYSPSAVDENLAGDYFAALNSLTAEYVQQVAKKYLGAAAVVVTLSPPRRLPTSGATLPNPNPLRGER